MTPRVSILLPPSLMHQPCPGVCWVNSQSPGQHTDIRRLTYAPSPPALDMPWRLLATQFTGNEGDPDELPSWVVDAVLRGANVVPKVRVIDTVCTVISINGHRATMHKSLSKSGTASAVANHS